MKWGQHYKLCIINMKKISEVSYKTQSGHSVVVRVTKVHEVVKDTVWVDQEVEIERVVENSLVEVSLDGGAFVEAQIGKFKGFDILGYGDTKTMRYTRIVIPSDKLEEVRNLQSERLIDELSSEEKESIKDTLNAVSAGLVLPYAELIEKRKEYRNEFLEGGEGYNPYDSYITREHLDYMKKRYPKEFENIK